MASEEHVRHSVAEEATLVRGDDEIARKEAANALVQTRAANEIILSALHGDRPFRLRSSHFLQLNRCAIEGLSAYAGSFRPGAVAIGHSKHTPPAAHLVPSLVEDLCDYVNSAWDAQSGLQLAAFALWRTNWIHPFTDGNGRTARAVANVVLSVKEGVFLPGGNTIPEQIVANRKAYYDALESADARAEAGEVGAGTNKELEEILGRMLASQLYSYFEKATAEARPET